MKTFLIIFALFCGFSANAIQSESCACGNFETSIIKYSVGEGQDCCQGNLNSETAMQGFYEENEGVWELVSVEIISSTTARDSCCKE